MKTRITIITSVFLSLLLFSGCQSESTSDGLQEEVKEIQRLEEESGNIENNEDAFELMRNLNQTMKDVRDKILEMEANYRKATENERKEMESEFEKANAQINESLKVISENVEPYKDEEQVSQMLNKLQEVMISK